MVTWHLTMELFAPKMPWAGNIAKTMTSNRKQFTVSSLLPAKYCQCYCFTLSENAVEGGLMLSLESQRVFIKIGFCFVLLYDKSLNNWSLVNLVSLEIAMFPETNELRFSGNKIRCPLRDQSLGINCYTRDMKKVLPWLKTMSRSRSTK